MNITDLSKYRFPVSFLFFFLCCIFVETSSFAEATEDRSSIAKGTSDETAEMPAPEQSSVGGDKSPGPISGGDDIKRYEVDVYADRFYPQWAMGGPGPVASALSGLPGVLVNSQGAAAIQSDLSIRGSSFSGAGLAVNGLALRNPQTEHFHTELPLPPGLFFRPDILTGLEQVLGSSGYLVGTVDLEFLPIHKGGRIELGVGEAGWDWQDFIYQLPVYEWDGNRLGMSIFGSRQVIESVDYSDNDLDCRNGGVHFQVLGEANQTDIVVARQNKSFGARGYYGVTPDWFADEELDDQMVLAGSRWGDTQDRYVRMAALFRSMEDQYRLYWIQPDIYENQHRYDTAAFSLDGRQDVVRNVFINWRMGAESEDLESNRLGDHSRERGDLLFLPELTLGRLSLFAGARDCVFSEESPELLSETGCRFALMERQLLFCSYTEGVRQPSYTELNYESPGSLGNEGLEREETGELEIGWSYNESESHSWQVAAFQRKSEHTVDWIKELSSSTYWVATDLGTVDTLGVEFSSSHRLWRNFDLSTAYTWLCKDHDQEFYASRYVLDYPRHLIQLAGEWRITDSLHGVYSQALRWQEPSEARDSDRFGSDARLAMYFSPRNIDGLELAVACDNLWNDHFEVYLDEPVGDRRFSFAVAYAWK